ncbi:aminoglycoside phosphotransferase family protein [Streptomyces sp. B6B3]|uniref:aminoglycoside phosphotransferase family protein n=1 Tax=Streptomyces sp. B6B3 TaxID=3153570 RepID=UPI00325DE406
MSQLRTRTTTAPTLRGNHRVWHILRPTGDLAALGPLKAGRPRSGVHRFDPRCFDSEEDLLVELALLGVDRIPPVYRLGTEDLLVHGYIEGEVLSALRPPGAPLSDLHLDQLVERFGGLATIPPSALELVHSCPRPGRPRHGGEFMHGLVRFTRRHVYAVHRPELHRLFAALRIDPGVLAADGVLARAADRLTDRPFCLLHGDLHRDNLIVAQTDGALWTIDWELAMLGDPVYDLATHLHLMRYPRAQEFRMVTRWAEMMDQRLPGAARGLDRDLPRYLAYKRVQSVFTDVIRQGFEVRRTPPARLPEQLARTARVVCSVLRAAAEPLGLGRMPSPRSVERAYAALHREHPTYTVRKRPERLSRSRGLPPMPHPRAARD